MFKTTDIPKPAAPMIPSPPLIEPNATLEQDKETVLRCWLAMGGKDDDLRRGYYSEDYKEVNMREKPSDDVSEWFGVNVEGGRVTKLSWWGENLTGSIPSEIGALSALTHLYLGDNELSGSIPPELGALAALEELYLHGSSLSGVVPSTLANLQNLIFVSLEDNDDLSNTPDYSLDSEESIQAYFAFMNRRPTVRFLNYGIAITKKRQASLERRFSPRRATSLPHPFFAFLANYEHSLTDLILSYLDPWFCCNKDRLAVLAFWKSLGRDEINLRQGYGDDIARWRGLRVEGWRVARLCWEEESLSGCITSTSELFELDALWWLSLGNNEISGHLPSEMGKLTSLKTLYLDENSFSGAVPPTLANLTKVTRLSLRGNNFNTDVPSTPIFDREAQQYLTTLRTSHDILE